MGKKRLYKSWLGIPNWVITGGALFILFSAMYDYVVLDRSLMRYGLIIASGLILLMSVIMHFVSLNTISRQARRQLGGD